MWLVALLWLGGIAGLGNNLAVGLAISLHIAGISVFAVGGTICLLIGAEAGHIRKMVATMHQDLRAGIAQQLANQQQLPPPQQQYPPQQYGPGPGPAPQ